MKVRCEVCVKYEDTEENEWKEIVKYIAYICINIYALSVHVY